MSTPNARILKAQVESGKIVRKFVDGSTDIIELKQLVLNDAPVDPTDAVRKTDLDSVDSRIDSLEDGSSMAVENLVYGPMNDETGLFSPADGTLVIVGDTPSGDFSSFNPNDLIEYDESGDTWNLSTLSSGTKLLNDDNQDIYELTSTDPNVWNIFTPSVNTRIHIISWNIMVYRTSGGSYEAIAANLISSVDETLDASDIIDFVNSKGENNGLAELDGGGKVPTTQLPGIALIDVNVVADEAAQLSLEIEEGDIVIRTDLSKTFVHNGGTAGDMSDFTELLTTGAVSSVNGKTATVVLNSGDIEHIQISDDWNLASGTISDHLEELVGRTAYLEGELVTSQNLMMPPQRLGDTFSIPYFPCSYDDSGKLMKGLATESSGLFSLAGLNMNAGVDGDSTFVLTEGQVVKYSTLGSNWPSEASANYDDIIYLSADTNGYCTLTALDPMDSGNEGKVIVPVARVIMDSEGDKAIRVIDSDPIII